MNRVLVSVEGQTEETFVQNVLRNYLWNHNVDIQPVILTTHRVKQGPNFKGGILSYSRTRAEIIRLLNDSNASFITTMYDLYQLPQDFPGQDTCPNGAGQAKAQHLENAFQQEICSQRFQPYLQVHEFEAFLFVDPIRTASMFTSRHNLSNQLQLIRQSFPTPEDINDSPITAPSKRILALYPQYEKPLYGTIISLEVGLDAIRAECPHFNDWVTRLEGLG